MGMRVLIVEDEQIVAADLEGKLRRLGHAVVGMAASGEESVMLAEQERPDVVLMDIRLQGATPGTEAAKMIQEKTGAAIIYVTAYADIFVRDPAQMQPPGICLSKPFSRLQLQAALDALASPRKTQ